MRRAGFGSRIEEITLQQRAFGYGKTSLVTFHKVDWGMSTAAYGGGIISKANGVGIFLR
jgi:hypothetical protein